MPQDYQPATLIVGKFAPPHQGHQLLIETALRNSSNLTILVYSNPDFEPLMPSRRRAEWLKQLYPQANVFVPENPPPNDADDFTQREFVKQWLAERGLQIELVYTSESYGEGFANHIGAKHVLVDLARTQVTISGTKMREVLTQLEQTRRISSNPYRSVQYDDALLEQLAEMTDPYIYQQLLHWLDPVHKVVFMGAESTGKSTLTEVVAKELNMPFVTEYGREHYEKKGGILELEDYVYIARKHRELEDTARLRMLGTNKSRYLFVDTNALTTLFFSYYYNQGGLLTLHMLANECKGRYHHVFVCADDIPFEQDGWRDNEIWRARMQGMVLHDLDSRGIHYTILRGSLEERVEQVKTVLAGGKIQTVLQPKNLGPKPKTIV
jgi:HTH-type transcriptional regulator, transcriptional repressor of NAD biosynthesis genes